MLDGREGVEVRLSLAGVMVVVLGLSGGAAVAQEAADAAAVPGVVRPMVAVLPFESGDLPESWHWTWGGRIWPAGMGIADLFAQELRRELRGRPVVLADPDAIYRALLDRGLQREDGISAELAAEIARARGAQYFVTGRVGLFDVRRTVAPLRIDQDWYVAYVALDAMLVDARSLHTLRLLRGQGTWQQTGRGWETGNRARVDLSSGFFAGTLLGRATGVALRSVASDIEDVLRPPALSGAWLEETGPAVVGVDARRITINAGAWHGVAVGDAFEVRKLEDGVVLGTLTIDEVGEVLASGLIAYPVRGTRARVGDPVTAVGG